MAVRWSCILRSRWELKHGALTLMVFPRDLNCRSAWYVMRGEERLAEGSELSVPLAQRAAMAVAGIDGDIYMSQERIVEALDGTLAPRAQSHGRIQVTLGAHKNRGETFDETRARIKAHAEEVWADERERHGLPQATVTDVQYRTNPAAKWLWVAQVTYQVATQE